VEEERDRPGRELAEDEQYKIRQERYWKDSNESRKKMGLPEIPRQEFETGLKLRLEERRKAREARRPKQESSGSEPQPTGSEPEPADTCLPYAAQREIDVDVFLRTRSAIRKQADALQNSNDPILRKVGGDLERLAEQVRPPEAGATPSTAPPAPISLWIHGWPPGAARNAGPGLVFDVASVSSFRDAGVLHLSNTWSGPPALPGSVYAERDQPRTVAPAPSLDPARWPSTSAPVLSLSLEEPAP
jgi:hypothetical protein